MAEKQNLFSRLLKNFSKQEGLDDILLMSEHWNGYKRENAVRRLGMLGNPLAIPNLIIRSNDWVPQVRIAAKEALSKLAISKNIEAFIKALPELYHLKNCSRDSHDNLISSIEEYMLSNKNIIYLINGLHDENPFVARACISLIIENNLMEEVQIVRVGLAHPDLIVRVKVSHLLKGLTKEVQTLALNIAINDRFMPIRREAFLILIQIGIDNGLVKELLFDRHSSVREIAIKYLVNQNIDVRIIYQESISSSRVSAICCGIWGLGQCKNSEDVLFVKSFLTNPSPSVRKQSLNTLVMLMDEEANNVIENSLSDESPAVCKEAARLSRKNGVNFTAARLLEIINGSEYKHTFSSCIGISKRMNKWDRLIFLFSLLDTKYLNKLIEKQQIQLALRQWDIDYNRSSSQPTKSQLDVLGCKVNEYYKILSSYEYRSIIFSLKSYGVVFEKS